MASPHIFIQWKGTDVCLDFYCKCGEQGHFDGDFAYRLKCGACGTIYELPDTLPIKEVTDDGDHQVPEMRADANA